MKHRMMVAVLLALCLAGAAAIMPRAAQAATQSQTPTAHCLVTKVVLHRRQAPQTTCLRTQAEGKAPAFWTESNCWDDLILYQDAWYGAEQLCFTGVGSVRLTDYSLSCWLCGANWNDQVSSFKTGLTFGHFSWDINDLGAHYSFSSNENVPWIGRAWNDQISGVTIDGPNW